MCASHVENPFFFSFFSPPKPCMDMVVMDMVDMDMVYVVMVDLDIKCDLHIFPITFSHVQDADLPCPNWSSL